jgi:hypothetical protein
MLLNPDAGQITPTPTIRPYSLVDARLTSTTAVCCCLCSPQARCVLPSDHQRTARSRWRCSRARKLVDARPAALLLIGFSHHAGEGNVQRAAPQANVLTETITDDLHTCTGRER